MFQIHVLVAASTAVLFLDVQALHVTKKGNWTLTLYLGDERPYMLDKLQIGPYNGKVVRGFRIHKHTHFDSFDGLITAGPIIPGIHKTYTICAQTALVTYAGTKPEQELSCWPVLGTEFERKEKEVKAKNKLMDMTREFFLKRRQFRYLEETFPPPYW